MADFAEAPVSLYSSLDEARRELAARWNDRPLRAAIERELGDCLLPEFSQAPRGVLWRCLHSPDNVFTFFYQCARYVGALPLALEFLGDRYSRGNEDKRALGKLRVDTEDGAPATFNLFSSHRWDRRPLSEIVLDDGASLIGFHRDLMQRAGFPVELGDKTDWCRARGKPAEWYYPFLLHFVAHGVLFESYTVNKESEFYASAVFPNIERIRRRFALAPLIVSPLPEPDTQTPREDFYWRSYPPHVNAWLLDYARRNGLALSGAVFSRHTP